MRIYSLEVDGVTYLLELLQVPCIVNAMVVARKVTAVSLKEGVCEYQIMECIYSIIRNSRL